MRHCWAKCNYNTHVIGHETVGQWRNCRSLTYKYSWQEHQARVICLYLIMFNTNKVFKKYTFDSTSKHNIHLFMKWLLICIREVISSTRNLSAWRIWLLFVRNKPDWNCSLRSLCERTLQDATQKLQHFWFPAALFLLFPLSWTMKWWRQKKNMSERCLDYLGSPAFGR